MAAIHARRRAIEGSRTDANVLAYMLATGIPNTSVAYYAAPYATTGAAIWASADTFIRGLKNAGLWARIQGLYPVLGGTLASCAVNARKPGTNNLTYRNAPACDARGIRFNPAATQLANTNFASEQFIAGDGAAIDYYSADNTFIGGDVVEMGGWQPDGGVLLAIKIATINNLVFGRIGSSVQQLASTVSPGTSAGLFTINRTAADVVTLYKNGAGIAPPTTFTDARPMAFYPITLGALAQARDPVAVGAFGYSDRGCSLACVRGSFTQDEMTTYYNLIQAFQAANFRAV